MLRITSNRAASELAHHTKVLGRHEKVKGEYRRKDPAQAASTSDERARSAVRDEGNTGIDFNSPRTRSPTC